MVCWVSAGGQTSSRPTGSFPSALRRKAHHLYHSGAPCSKVNSSGGGDNYSDTGGANGMPGLMFDYTKSRLFPQSFKILAKGQVRPVYGRLPVKLIS
jgi:hypothetical protein